MMNKKKLVKQTIFCVIIATILFSGCAKETDVTLKFIGETTERPFQNDHVRITDLEGNKTFVGLTNTNGEVKFDSVPIGKYKMTFICHPNQTIQGDAGYAQTREFDVWGFVLSKTFKVQHQNSSHTNRSVIIYTLFESNNLNINDADVRLTNLSTQSEFSQRTTFGSAVFIEVPTGNYRLTISHPSITTFERDINVNTNFLGEYRLQ
ncbi:MAG: carboxypeptidase-like regulatory domain-containing protein [Candidatus Cloacimonetes bacterium]|nr:carboxypeptidase-like regulatory domain-containing protein [Candidatus Cloacimonadota bacterium]